MRFVGLAILVASLLTPAFASAQDTAPPAAKERSLPIDLPSNWATARARSLTEQGQSHANAGSTDLAVRRFNEALEVDGTFEAAYLALATLRTSMGEFDEALLVLDMGLERIHGFVAAVKMKADVLSRAKRHRDATSVHLQALGMSPDDEAWLAKIVPVAAQAGIFPVALGAARRLWQLAKERGDGAAEKDARITVLALSNLVAEMDPVRSGRNGRDPVRRAIARAVAK